MLGWGEQKFPSLKIDRQGLPVTPPDAGSQQPWGRPVSTFRHRLVFRPTGISEFWAERERKSINIFLNQLFLRIHIWRKKILFSNFFFKYYLKFYKTLYLVVISQWFKSLLLILFKSKKLKLFIYYPIFYVVNVSYVTFYLKA